MTTIIAWHLQVLWGSWPRRRQGGSRNESNWFDGLNGIHSRGTVQMTALKASRPSRQKKPHCSCSSCCRDLVYEMCLRSLVYHVLFHILSHNIFAMNFNYNSDIFISLFSQALFGSSRSWEHFPRPRTQGIRWEPRKSVQVRHPSSVILVPEFFLVFLDFLSFFFDTPIRWVCWGYGWLHGRCIQGWLRWWRQVFRFSGGQIWSRRGWSDDEGRIRNYLNFPIILRCKLSGLARPSRCWGPEGFQFAYNAYK